MRYGYRTDGRLVPFICTRENGQRPRGRTSRAPIQPYVSSAPRQPEVVCVEAPSRGGPFVAYRVKSRDVDNADRETHGSRRPRGHTMAVDTAIRRRSSASRSARRPTRGRVDIRYPPRPAKVGRAEPVLSLRRSSTHGFPVVLITTVPPKRRAPRPLESVQRGVRGSATLPEFSRG